MHPNPLATPATTPQASTPSHAITTAQHALHPRNVNKQSIDGFVDYFVRAETTKHLPREAFTDCLDIALLIRQQIAKYRNYAQQLRDVPIDITKVINYLTDETWDKMSRSQKLSLNERITKAVERKNNDVAAHIRYLEIHLAQIEAASATFQECLAEREKELAELATTPTITTAPLDVAA